MSPELFESSRETIFKSSRETYETHVHNSGQIFQAIDATPPSHSHHQDSETCLVWESLNYIMLDFPHKKDMLIIT